MLVVRINRNKGTNAPNVEHEKHVTRKSSLKIPAHVIAIISEQLANLWSLVLLSAHKVRLFFTPKKVIQHIPSTTQINETTPAEKHALFMSKVITPDAFTKYYQLPPQGVGEMGSFETLSDFLTAEDAAILLDEYIQKNSGNSSLDSAHTKVIEDTKTFDRTKSYLDELLPKLNDGQSGKILLKRDDGAHFFSLYIYKDQGQIHTFVFDPGLGISVFSKDAYAQLQEVLKQVISPIDPSFKIVVSSAIVQSDTRNCSSLSIKALQYFMKQGAAFQAIMKDKENYVPDDKKICDKAKDYIVHLKVTSLPAGLAKKTQRHLGKAISTVYQHHLPEVALPLSKEYFDTDQNAQFYANKAQENIKSRAKPPVTLSEYIQKHTRMSNIGKPWNYAAIDDMNKMRSKIGKILQQQGIIDNKNQCNKIRLNQFLQDLKLRLLLIS